MKSGSRKFKFGFAGRLTLYSVITQLIFALVMGVAFSFLFRNNMEDLHLKNMRQTAYNIRDMMTALAKDQGSIVIGDQDQNATADSEHEAYLSREKFGRLVAGFMTDSAVWLVALNSQGTSFDMLFMLPSTGNSGYNDTLFEHLPHNTQNFIQAVYSGQEKSGTVFSHVMGERTLTVGVPIPGEGHSIMGAVLIHSNSYGVTESLQSSILVLYMSMHVALLAGFICMIFVVRRFSKPLRKINDTALLISEGDYTVKTDVHSSDEIGMLAETIDNMSGKLQKANEESQHLMQLRQEFVANISHELRTPVTVMRGSLEALCDQVVTDPDMVDQYHHELLRESMYMQRLVNDLLDLSRLQNAGFTMNMQTFNLYDCIVDAVRSGRRVADEKGITVDFTYDQTEFMYFGDYDRIRQMFLIVLDNAVKFTTNPDHAVTVIFQNQQVSVTNIGAGIQPEDLPFVFERFYKTRSETNKNGTGLGLAIAKQIAIRHQIELTVASVPGNETTFCFAFNRTENCGER